MSKNIEMKEKLSDGSYDSLYPKTTATNTVIADAAGYFTATNVEGALQEVAGVANAAVPKVTTGVTGNLVAFAASGNQADSGKKPADFAPAMSYDSKTVTFASIPANGNAKASITAYSPSGYTVIAAICVAGTGPDNVICSCNWYSNMLYVSAHSYWTETLTNVTATIRLTYAKI